jgi:hypothetical protein
VVALVILSWRAQYVLRHNLEADVVTTLEREARLTRDALPPDPATPVTAILGLVAQVTNVSGALLYALASQDLRSAIATLTDGELGQLLTKLTGVQLAQVLDGDALNRALAALVSLSTPQLVAVLQTTADAVHDGVPYPANFVLQTVLEVGANVLSDRDAPVPAQVTSLIAQPPVTAPAPTPAVVGPTMRARIFDVTTSRDRRTLRVELTCPAASSTACAVTVRTAVAGRSASKARRVTISRGRTKVLRPALSAAARKRLAHGGTVRVTAATKGSSRGALTSTVRVPALRGS